MDIVLGVGLMAVTALFFAFGYAAHRNTPAARWTRLPGLSMMFSVVLTLMGPVALGFVVRAILDPVAQWQSLHFWAVAPALGLVALAIVGAPLIVKTPRRGAPAGLSADNRNRAPSGEIPARAA